MLQADRNRQFLGSFSRVGAIVVSYVGCAVLLGWLLKINWLKGLIPGLATMKANTACAFIAAGLAVWFLLPVPANPQTRRRRLFGLFLATAVAVLGGLTLAEDLFTVNLGIDELLFHDAQTMQASNPGRMSPTSALSFLLVGLALLPLGNGPLRVPWRTSWLNVPVMLISTLALVGYAYGAGSLYRVGPYSSMALHTALAFLLLSISIFAADAMRGFIGVVMGDTAGSLLARRLLPTLPLVIFSLGLARFAGEQAGLYDARFGLALMVMSVIVVTTALIVWNAKLLHKMDLARRQSEAENISLRQSLADRKFESLLESAPDAMVIVNEQGKIILVNSQTESLFGYQRVELLDKKVEMLVPGRFHGTHPQDRSRYHANPHVRAMGVGPDLFGLRKDGVEFPVEISLSLLETEEGVLVSSSIRDISERKSFEHALQEKNAELENANLAKDRFLATMSHELRTPLNAIIGFTGTLLMRFPGPLTGDQEKQLQTVQSSAGHLLSLINDLLDLAKIGSGKVELSLEPVVCQGVLEEVSSALRPLALAKGLTLETVSSTKEIVVLTDRRALSQILLNLTNNAIKFTDEGGVRLEITQRFSDDHKITEISVFDTGVGIRQEDQARLFQAFAHMEPASSGRRYEGTGLGLHLSQKLAELLSGQIIVTSERGKGSKFTLELREGCPMLDSPS